MTPLSRRRGYVRQEVVIAGFEEDGCVWRDISDAMHLVTQQIEKDGRTEEAKYDDFVKVEINANGDLVFWYQVAVADTDGSKK